MTYRLIPLSLKEAQEFVNRFHRHHNASYRDKFRIGLVKDKNLVGVVMVGRPVSRVLDDKLTLEVNRCCVLDGNRNACSMLYGAAARVAKNLGYSKIVTYTLDFESGSSLRAVGWTLESSVKGQNWNRPSREREQKSDYQTFDKYRWGKVLADKIDYQEIIFPKDDKEDQQLTLFR